MQALTIEQARNLPTTVSLIIAARALGIGRTAAYQLAKNDEFPVRIIHAGGYRIPTAELLRVLGITPPGTQVNEAG